MFYTSVDRTRSNTSCGCAGGEVARACHRLQRTSIAPSEHCRAWDKDVLRRSIAEIFFFANVAQTSYYFCCDWKISKGIIERMVELGAFERLDVRSVWKHEANNFTRWLAQPENLNLLGETLGIGLELVASEQWIGDFRADIVCAEIHTDKPIVIENQLEATNHNHLGQIITYAAGTSATTIIWIATYFREEHRAALDWLNDNTAEDIQFFGIEIELWRIGDSVPAPRFNIVSSPNNWTKAVKATSSQSTTKQGEKYIRFWTGFRDFLQEHGFTQNRKPPNTHYYDFAIGHSLFVLVTLAGMRDQFLVVQINAKRPHYFKLLQQQQNELQAAFDERLIWDFSTERTQNYIVLRTEAIDPSDEAQWQAAYEWLMPRLFRMLEVFQPLIQQITRSDMA